MSLESQLTALERAELIRRVQSAPEVEYLFRHALMQEAAYGSLLRSTRRELHAAIGATLEQLYTDRRDELAPVLARHYAEADHPVQALEHYARAGELAAAKHANLEALMHLDAALDMARRAGRPTAALHIARGRICELTGEFERARADFDAALSEARVTGDRRAEWEALIASGFLWAARDYGRTGAYFQESIALARSLGDPHVLAQSLNRLGNWHANIEQPQEAMRLHHEALAVYERLADARGTAETHDLLAMAGLLSTDLVQAEAHARRAAEGFLALNSLREAASSMMTGSYTAPNIGSEQSVVPDVSVAEALRSAHEALHLARQIGWRSGEAFALVVVSELELFSGGYGAALEAAREALDAAAGIGHVQWEVAAHIALGVALAHIAGLQAAETNLHAARSLAAKVGSGYWPRSAAGSYALMAARFGDEPDWHKAEAYIEAALGTGASPAGRLTFGQRFCWVGRIELALARRDAGNALALADALIASLPNTSTPHTSEYSPLMCLLRGEALLTLCRCDEAATDLERAWAIYERFGLRPSMRRVLLAKSRLYSAHGDETAAQAALARANALASELAAGIPDPAQREAYLARMQASRTDHA